MTDDRVSEHFIWSEVTRSETAQRLGIANAVPQELRNNVHRSAEMMEQIRQLVGGPIKVNSWYRSPALNAAVGGSKTSAHPKGLAVDWEPTTMTLEDAFNLVAASEIEFDQLIIEGTRDGADWIHTGLSEGPPRREVLRAHGDTLGGRMAYTRVSSS